MTEGFVSLLEPFIDTIVICSLTALVIITTTYYDPELVSGVGGIEMTSSAFARNISWSPYPLALVATLFAISTMIALVVLWTEGVDVSVRRERQNGSTV